MFHTEINRILAEKGKQIKNDVSVKQQKKLGQKA